MRQGADAYGSGYAVQCALADLDELTGEVLVTMGDVPHAGLGDPDRHARVPPGSAAAVTLLTAHFDDPTGYGRIIRGPGEVVEAVVEQKDASPEQVAITEINAGTLRLRRRAAAATPSAGSTPTTRPENCC